MQMLKDAKSDPAVYSFLSKPTIVNGLVEILAVSLDREVLRMSIFILSELILVDVSIAETLTSLKSDVDCLVELFKNGLVEAVILIHQLRPSFARLSENDLIPSLNRLIASTNQEPNDSLKFFIEPKDAGISMLEQILVGGDEHVRYKVIEILIVIYDFTISIDSNNYYFAEFEIFQFHYTIPILKPLSGIEMLEPLYREERSRV